MAGPSNGNGSGLSWTHLVSMAAAAFQLLSLVVWWAMTTQMGQLQHQAELDRAYNKNEINALTAAIGTQFVRVEERKRIDDRYDELRSWVQTISNKYLATETYKGKHEALEERVKRAEDRIIETRNDFSKIYTPTDTIKELQDRIKILEARIASGSSKEPHP